MNYFTFQSIQGKLFYLLNLNWLFDGFNRESLRGRMIIVDLLVLTSSDQLLLILKIYISFVTKQAIPGGQP